MEELLTCTGLTKRYGAKLALDHVNLTITGGKIIGLLGPNGSGKTTLIKLANGLLAPTEGWVAVRGQTPCAQTKAEVSYLPDASYLSLNMKVKQLVKMFTEFYADFEEEKAWAMLRELHIEPQAKLKTLSKGNREKVQLILAMSRRAKLYLLDEPIGGVDPAAREYILNTILRSYCEDAAVVISTHLISEVEQVLDEVVFLREGRVLLHKSVDELREETGMSVDGYFREVFKC